MVYLARSDLHSDSEIGGGQATLIDGNRRFPDCVTGAILQMIHTTVQNETSPIKCAAGLGEIVPGKELHRNVISSDGLMHFTSTVSFKYSGRINIVGSSAGRHEFHLMN